MKITVAQLLCIYVVCTFASPLLGNDDAKLFTLVHSFHNPTFSFLGDFGEAVAVSPVDGTIAITAMNDDEAALNAGAVYIYGDDGELLRKVSQPDSIANGRMGVTADFTTKGDLVLGNWTPRIVTPVFILNAEGNAITRVSNPESSDDGQWGTAVAAIGENVLISSLFEDGQEEDAGAVYLFDTDGNQIRRFVSPDQTPRGLFGRYISVLDDETFVVGAYAESHDASEAGRVYVFNIDGALVGRLENPNPTSRDLFGIHVSKAGDDILVGSIHSEENPAGGEAYLFSRTGELLQTFNNPLPDPGDWFGYYATAIDDYVIVGAPFEAKTARSQGAVYVFSREGELHQTLLDPTPGDSGSFSYVFAFDDTLYVSAPFDGAGPEVRGPGSVYVYKLNILPGDVDMDGDVDLDDFSALKNNFGNDVTTRTEGDLTGDLHVSLEDFAQLKENFGRSEPVPEPAALQLSLAGIAIAAWFIRRRSLAV